MGFWNSCIYRLTGQFLPTLVAHKAFWVIRLLLEGDSCVTDKFVAFIASLHGDRKKKKFENIMKQLFI